MPGTAATRVSGVTGSNAKGAAAAADGESDEALIEAIAGRRDRTAFAALFRRYAGRIKSFLMRSGATADEAEEAAQEVMVQLWRRAETYDPGRAAARSWIYTIARNKRIDLLRRARRPEPDPEDPTFRPDPEDGTEARLAGVERDAKVRLALAALSDDQLTVVRLAFFAGLSHSEIAERLDAPLGTVKSRLRLSFHRLRDELGPEIGAELRDD